MCRGRPRSSAGRSTTRPGAVAEVACRSLNSRTGPSDLGGTLAQLGDGLGHLGGRQVRAGLRQLRRRRERELPIDHVTNYTAWWVERRRSSRWSSGCTSISACGVSIRPRTRRARGDPASRSRSATRPASWLTSRRSRLRSRRRSCRGRPAPRVARPCWCGPP